MSHTLHFKTTHPTPCIFTENAKCCLQYVNAKWTNSQQETNYRHGDVHQLIMAIWLLWHVRDHHSQGSCSRH